MNKKFKKILVVILSLVLASATITPAMATPIIFDYVALGDSDAAGVRAMPGELPGWEDGSKYGYNDLIADWLDDQNTVGMFNEKYCISGNTAANLAIQTARPDAQNILSKAEIVTITIGANDVIQPIYNVFENYVAGMYSSEQALFAALADALSMCMVNFGDGAELTGNIYTVLTNILNANPDVKIYVMGYYNPLPCVEEILGAGMSGYLSVAVESTINTAIYAAIKAKEAELGNVSNWESIRYIDTIGTINGEDWDYAYENGYLYYEGEGGDYDFVPNYIMADIHLTEAGYEAVAGLFETYIAADFDLIS